MLARYLVLALALGSPASALTPLAPPVIEVGRTGAPLEPHVLTWQASKVACAKGAIIAPAQFVSPDPQPLAGKLGYAPQTVTLHFAIDADGRPLDITTAAEPLFRPQFRDFIPSLRASRFAAGAPQADCTIQYTPETRSIAEAPLATLASLGVAQRLRMGKEAWNRIAPGNCRETPRLAPLARSYPDFRNLTRREGSREWTYVTFDVDSDGVPVNLATPLTTGYAALDAEARAAVAAGRYAGGPRTGCVQAWWTGAETIPAPPIPPAQDTQGNPACEIKDRWEREPRLVFPSNYQQRAIEGWAILRYDVAPWGQIGEIEVLEAQPSSEFGEAATSVIRNARFKPLETGLKGCIDRVIFRIRSKNDASEESGTADPA